MKTHKDLDVWKISMDFVIDIYKLTKSLPSSEKYGLLSQMHRAVISIPSNIAEGAARKNKKEFIQFLYIALGSLAELETQLEIADRLKYLSYSEKINNTGKSIRLLILGLIRNLNTQK